MPSSAKKGRQACNRLAFSNRQWVMISRAKNGDCTYCPPNGGENTRGSHSKWGKKVGAKKQYAAGKKRKQWFEQFQYRNRFKNDGWYDKRFYDKHYEYTE